MAYSVVLSAQAMRDLKQIRDFIALDNPSAAARFTEVLLERGQGHLGGASGT